jgi:hypothetical protein
MQITIDMQLLLTLLVLVGIAAGVFLIILLIRLIGAIKRISQLADQVHEPISTTVEQLPALTKRMDAITVALSTLSESASQSVPVILKDAQAITGTARAGVESIGGAAKAVGEGVSSFFNPEPSSSSTLGSIVEVISQIISVVSLFAGHRSTKSKTGNRKKRRR